MIESLFPKIENHKGVTANIYNQNGEPIYALGKHNFNDPKLDLTKLAKIGPLRYIVSYYEKAKEIVPIISETSAESEEEEMESTSSYSSDSGEGSLSKKDEETAEVCYGSVLKGFEVKFPEKIPENSRLLTMIELLKKFYDGLKGNGKIS
eukprot:CAMPEP_0114592774 /NCGR_PEP_ID=MMETSP0125-20121206/14519_1 /TAXON_ID=485358 ORGANISM="Aristerostoma sp., Strain ATCC 50986" /NCGR_SAMPLE_ID=MMETSP0125 /ASSEMBLY_ACC=CAM_ASM_000245 /LENGTH=149 /DNA_ID=CAMNT_0001791591 /DNA_START=186 /DNA_END=635 /DNA_ORIENTATION=+